MNGTRHPVAIGAGRRGLRRRRDVHVGHRGAGQRELTTQRDGQTYSDASTALSNAGFTPVVSTTVGDQKSWPDCLVINVVGRSVPPPENSSGSSTNQALVSLNCYSAEASAKGSGYSAASPEGKAIAAAAKQKADEEKAAEAKGKAASTS